MLQIPSPYAVVHPGTVVVHTADTAIAYAAMVAAFGFVRFTYGTHGEFIAVGSILFGGNGAIFGYGTWIGKSCFGVRCKCQGAEGAVDGGDYGIHGIVLC